MFCSVCKDEYDKCLHIRGKEYKNIAYYFYIEDRKEQSESDVADLITIKEDESNPYNYKNKIYAVVKFETNNEEKFREAWENVGKFNESACCVYAVMMNMHGTPTEISNGPGKGYSLRMNIDDIIRLKESLFKDLYFCSVRSEMWIMQEKILHLHLQKNKRTGVGRRCGSKCEKIL